MKDSLYFSHDGDARNDLKIKALIKRYGIEGYGIYWIILELMRAQENYKLSKKEYVLEGVCDEIGKDMNFLRGFLNDCVKVFELFSNDKDYFWSESFLKRMGKKDEIIELKRKAGLASAEKRRSQSHPPEPTPVEQPSGKRSTINKEMNKQRKETNKKTIPKKESLLERKKELLQQRRALFKTKVFEFSESYDKQTLTEFYDYWSEADKNCVMRWEMEKTWEFDRRLSYWVRRSKEFKQSKNEFHASDY